MSLGHALKAALCLLLVVGLGSCGGNLPNSAVSRHLAILLQAGLVSAERQGQRVLYRLNRDALLDGLARFASELDGPLRRAPQKPHAPREAI